MIFIHIPAKGAVRDEFRAVAALGLVLACAACRAPAVTPQAGEFMACGAWVDRLFSTDAAAGGGQYLKLLYEDVPDGITRGKSWRGTPYQLGDKTYSHGIAFNSTKHILVHPGGPAQRFTAEIGLENNDDTRRGEALGQGSVTFHVLVGGKEAFASPVRRRKDGPMALDLPLGGAREFEIRVKDGGDGRGWDQALWGEAVVVLRTGRAGGFRICPGQGVRTPIHTASPFVAAAPTAPGC